jgi:hypothetical protein
MRRDAAIDARRIKGGKLKQQAPAGTLLALPHRDVPRILGQSVAEAERASVTGVVREQDA